MSWPNVTPANNDITDALAATDSVSFVGLLKRLKHRGLLRENKLPLEQYYPAAATGK